MTLLKTSVPLHAKAVFQIFYHFCHTTVGTALHSFNARAFILLITRTTKLRMSDNLSLRFLAQRCCL